MSYIIIIRGPAGVGKSTISQLLAKKLEAKYISFDKVLSDSNLDIVEGDCIKALNFLKANKIILPDILQNINNKIVILDGCFYHKSQIKDLVNKIPNKFFIFSLKAELEECIKRDVNRSGLAGMGNQRIVDVYKLVSKFDYGISIETNKKTVEEIVDNIKSFLPKKE